MHTQVVKLVGILAFVIISIPVLAQKTDKVYLKNGDVLTGEIKYLKFAKLSFDVTGPGTISIKWEYIINLHSDKLLQVTTKEGEVWITKLDSLFFKSGKATLDDIVEIVQIKDRFIQRLEGDINLGFNYNKSNDNLQFNLNSAVMFRRPKTEIGFKINSVMTHNSNDTITSKKQDITADYYRKLKNRFYSNLLGGWQQNTELGLRNRFIVNGGGGKILINDNHQRLLTGGGLSYNVEESNESTIYENSFEGMAVIQYKKFHYTTPKVSLDTRLIIYPSLTDWGRVRVDFKITSKFEIFKDFNVGINFYDLYDNRPPEGAASENDFGINFTLGYEFGK